MRGDDDLSDFDRDSFTFGGKRRDVLRVGVGPAVIVTSEISGITPGFADFARRVADAGFTAVVPHLFGVPGKALTPTYGLRTCLRSRRRASQA